MKKNIEYKGVYMKKNIEYKGVFFFASSCFGGGLVVEGKNTPLFLLSHNTPRKGKK